MNIHQPAVDFTGCGAPATHNETKGKNSLLSHISIPIIGMDSLAGLVLVSQIHKFFFVFPLKGPESEVGHRTLQTLRMPWGGAGVVARLCEDRGMVISTRFMFALLMLNLLSIRKL
jgi:hypothetical protein